MCQKAQDKPIKHVSLVSECVYMLACSRPGGYDFENFGADRAEGKEHGAEMLLIEKMKHKEDFTALERQISDYILEHRDEMFEMSLAQLAGKLYVSKATVIRYFKKLLGAKLCFALTLVDLCGRNTVLLPVVSVI